ncbi:MAG TPA: hypothetical protein VFV93_01340 [Thermomicrobiales bacterium]|nr:hypothetical protein [Thermomicrobiales bacterium]
MQASQITPYLPRALVYGAVGAAFAALTIGIPTDVIPNGFFTRMTPVRVQDYVFLIVTAILAGILAASYALPQTRACSIEQGRATLGGLLSFLAIGCPTCNKVIVLLLGTSGALNIFEPLQPLLALASFALLVLAIWIRWRPVVQQAAAVGVGEQARPAGFND